MAVQNENGQLPFLGTMLTKKKETAFQQVFIANPRTRAFYFIIKVKLIIDIK
jgi:hypothetical protein